MLTLAITHNFRTQGQCNIQVSTVYTSQVSPDTHLSPCNTPTCKLVAKCANHFTMEVTNYNNPLFIGYQRLMAYSEPL